MVMVFFQVFSNVNAPDKVALSRLIELVDGGHVREAKFNDKAQSVTIKVQDEGKKEAKYTSTYLTDQGLELFKRVQDKNPGVKAPVERPGDNVLVSLLLGLLPIGLVVLLLFFF